MLKLSLSSLCEYGFILEANSLPPPSAFTLYSATHCAKFGSSSDRTVLDQDVYGLKVTFSVIASEGPSPTSLTHDHHDHNLISL